MKFEPKYLFLKIKKKLESRHLSNLIKYSFICLSTLFIISCQTAPKKFSEEPQGHWTAKALIKDKKNFRSNILNIDWNAINHQKLRMDVTTPAGLHIASLIIVDDQIEYLLMREKKYYKGKVGNSVLKKIIPIPLHPNLLYDLLFDQPMANKDWTCSKDEGGYLKKCEQLSTNLLIEWSSRKGKKRTIQIDHKKASMQINLDVFSKDLSDRKNLFKLKIPKTFKRYRLR